MFEYEVQSGDTLSGIAQKHGFSTWQEAGFSGYKSGDPDLIYPGEKLTLANYDPNNIQTIGDQPDVISSEDSAQEFQQDSDKLDEMNQKTEESKQAEATPPNLDTGSEEKKKAIEGLEETGDPLVDHYNRGIAKLQAEVNESNARLADRTADEKTYYDTALAAIDKNVDAQLGRIKVTYDKRTKEQQRINQINVDRVKAYGLAGGGRFTPLVFSDSISNREEEAADKIKELDNERSSLIAEAEAARAEGKAKPLRDKMDAVYKVEDNIRKEISEAEKAAEKQYELYRESRKEQEAAVQKAIEEQQARFKTELVPTIIDDYLKLDEAGKTDLIDSLVKKGWGDFLTIYSTLLQAEKEQHKTYEEDQREKAKDQALINQRQASASASYALAQKRLQETDEGSNWTDTENKKLTQAGLEDAPEDIQLDFLYGDADEKEQALIWLNNQGGDNEDPDDPDDPEDPDDPLGLGV